MTRWELEPGHTVAEFRAEHMRSTSTRPCLAATIPLDGEGMVYG